MPPKTQSQNRLQTFYKEHKAIALSLLAGLILIIILAIVVIFTTSDDDGVPGTNSKAIEASLAEDQKALESFNIAKYLPIVSKDPAYTINYELIKNDNNNYSLRLILSAFSASARDAMVKAFLATDFGTEDPLNYELKLENYYNPFSNLSVDDLNANHLPENFEKGSLYRFGDSPYTVQTYLHTLYDGSKNTYRAVLENGKLKVKPQLLFTYAELPFLDQSQVKSLNTLE